MAFSNRLGGSLEIATFPEYLREAMGRPAPADPEINPVPQLETVRYLNGLSRAAQQQSWFEPPTGAEDFSVARREQLITRFVDKVRSESSGPTPLRRLGELLSRRQALLDIVRRQRSSY